MARLLGWISLAALLSLSSGCAMCCHPYDCHYLYQGGRWVRDIPDSGRVASAFDEAGHRVDEGVPVEHQQLPAEGHPGAVNTLPAPQENMNRAREPGMSPNMIPNSRLSPNRAPGGMMRPYLPAE